MRRDDRTIREEDLLAQMGWVQGLARSLLRDPNAAEDVAQEALLVAMERPPRQAVVGPGLHRWLASVTRTLARQLVRGERRRAQREHLAANARAELRDVIGRGAMQQRMSELVMKLDEPYRSTILHRYLDGLNAREIAERQGVSPATVRKRLSRGIEQLRGRLDDEFDGYRSAWLMALLPLTRSPGITVGSTSVLSGALLMSTQTKIITALILVAIGLVAFRASITESTPPEPMEELAGLPSSPTSQGPPPPAEGSSALAESREAGRAAVSAEEAETSAAPNTMITVRARILGADGQPLPGARLTAFGDILEPVQADHDGRVELELAGATQQRNLEAVAASLSNAAAAVANEASPWLGFTATAPGHTTREIFEPFDGSTVRELGTLRLVPVGAVAGVVMDEIGQPAPGASVCAVVARSNIRMREAMTLWGPDHYTWAEEARTDAQGEFALTSLPEGRWRVWAGAPGRVWSCSEVLSIDTASEQPWLELVLRDLPLENRLGGTVLRPDGTPFEGALLACAGPDEEELDFCEFDHSGPDGRFLLTVPARKEWYVRASDPADELGCVTTTDTVVGGTDGIVLTLRAPSPLRLVVADEEGEPVHAFAVRIAPAGEIFATFYGEFDDPDGRAEVPTPDRPYLVSVRAGGFARHDVGPFTPGPERELACTLERLASVRGHLRAGGEPVANGLVQLVRRGNPRAVDWLQGFPARLDGQGLVGVMTGSDGAFTLPIEQSGSYVLFAEAEGWAATEHGPLKLDRRREEEIDLVLTAGGAIEGLVRTPAEVSPAGIVVRFCRGDMRVHEARTDAEGWFRCDGLTPGSWMVRATPSPSSGGPRLRVNAIERREYDEDFVFPLDCEVFEGRVTRLDLDLTGHERAGLRGSLLLDGEPAASFSACLSPADVPWFTRRFGKEVRDLDADGTFDFGDDRQVGEYWLVAYSAGGSSNDLILVSHLSLERGDNVNDLAFETATLTGRVGAVNAGRTLCLVSHLEPSGFAMCPFEPDPSGTFHLDRVPAGRCTLHARGEGDLPDDPPGWPGVYELELASGESREIAVD